MDYVLSSPQPQPLMLTAAHSLAKDAPFHLGELTKEEENEAYSAVTKTEVRHRGDYSGDKTYWAVGAVGFFFLLKR